MTAHHPTRPQSGPDWQAIRGEYPPVLRGAYLDTACKGIPSPLAMEALAEHSRFLRECPGSSTTDDTIAALAQFDRSRTAAAALINADPTEIALVQSTQDGLNALAGALRLRRGDVVIAADTEFVGTVMPWLALARKGVRVRLVPHRNGRIDVAAFDAAIDARTRAVVVSSVQEVTGYVVEIDELARLCRDRGVLTIVDGVQHVGPLLLDVRRTPVDAVAVGGHKWLCAPFGMGFLYVRRDLHDRLAPSFPSYLTTTPPSGDWGSYLEDEDRLPTDAMRHATDARKLELGGIGSSLAAAGLAGALERLLAIGPSAIADRVRSLVRLTAELLEQAGATFAVPIDECAFVVFRARGTIDEDRDLVLRLADGGVSTSLRLAAGAGGIRVSPYFYNDEHDIERLAQIVASP